MLLKAKLLQLKDLGTESSATQSSLQLTTPRFGSHDLNSLHRRRYSLQGRIWISSAASRRKSAPRLKQYNLLRL